MTEETQTTDLANYDEMLAQFAKRQSKAVKPAISSIGTRAGVLSYNGTAVPGNKLDVIIIASTHANKLYDGSYDPNNLKNPICYAYSETGEDMRPHPAVPEPKHDNCRDCPYNQWGSDPKGGKGKACKNTYHLALIPADTKDAAAAEVALLSTPVMSGKEFGKYVNKLDSLYHLPTFAFKTQVGTVPDARSQFKLTFDDIGPVDKELLPGLMGRFESALQIVQREYEENTPEAAPDEKSEKRNKKF